MMWWLLACAEETVKKAPPGSDGGTDPTGTTETRPSGDGCRATPTGEDRGVLVSLPYTPSGGRSDSWALAWMQADGTLVDDGERFTMGRATYGTVVFTPDGTLALAPTEDGHVAVFDLVAKEVVHAEYDGGFYAVSITVDPSGEFAWVVDGNWPNNGGGLYRVDIDCDTGTLSGATRVIEAKLPQTLILDGDGMWLTGREIPGASSGADVARLAADLEVQSGVDAFGDEDAIVSGAALAGGWLVLGDINEFSGYPTRIARVDTTTGEATTTDLEDPISMVAFPDGSSRVLVASGYGDAYLVVDAATGTTTAVGASGVQLPSAVSVATWGSLRGHVVGSEVEGVRHLRLGDDVEDLGLLVLADGMEGIAGAVGIAP